MTLLQQQVLNAFNACLNSGTGIIEILVHQDIANSVVTPSLRAMQILYRFRREIGDVEMRKILIKHCPDDPENMLWLIRTDDDQPEG